MSRQNCRRCLLVVACFQIAHAQLPPPGTLAGSDWPLFRAEIDRTEKLLTTAPDKAAVEYQIARTWASAGQWRETVDSLRKVTALKAGLDPSRDPLFADIRETREFQEIVAAAREATPAISHSTRAFEIAEGDLVPESVAYDPRGKQFYFGSMKKGKVIRCSPLGKCAPFVTELGVVLGLKVNGDGLWLLNNSDEISALIHYDVASGREIRRFEVKGSGHNFNDLVIARTGDVYVTDTRAGAIWHLASGGADLTKIPGNFPAANGVALSSDTSLLYVSTYPDGITMVDLKTAAAKPIVRPPGLCLAMVDGLYFRDGALIAVQNGYMTPRVVRLSLTRDLRGIAGLDVLERRNPLFDGVTTGVVVGHEFFYMANIQDEKSTGFQPIVILKLGL